VTNLALAITFGYLVGALPFAFLMTRARGIDLRQAGSRNLGTANVLRTVGVAPAVTVMVLDVAKGALAVIVIQSVMGDLLPSIAAGLAAIVGHIYPFWLRFRGGKGVATSAGVFAVLAPSATAVAALAFVITIFMTRFVSAGSIVAAIALAVVAGVGGAPAPVFAAAVLAAVIVVVRHRGNISRLAAGTERRIGLRT
jgi:glycerol-3-phosphate acyltransferase PlsY